MRQSSLNRVDSAAESRTGEQASVRTIILVLIVFVLGIAVSAFWFNRPSKNAGASLKAGADGKMPIVLSDSTKAVLKRLDSPVEIRFYSLLDPATVPSATIAFAGRVEQMLGQYEQEANGKIKVTSFKTDPNTSASAATADGIKAFNIDKGDSCFLGLAIVHSDQKESLPQLSPEWEQAVEPDVTRAILRVTAAKAPMAALVAIQVDPAAREEVKRSIPDLDSVSLEDGTRLLREAALNNFKAAAQEMEKQVKEAQQRLIEAQGGQSEAEQQAAMKHLQQVQEEQNDKLKQIAAKSKAQIQALQQLKSAAR